MSAALLKTDFVILGAGVAGMFAALRLARQGASVLLLSKSGLEQSNSRYAQGGIAAVWAPEDCFEAHTEDTINAAAGLADPAAVKILVSEGPERIRELIAMGMAFDHEGEEIALSREGAHRCPRILHAGGDRTGKELVQFLAGAVRREPRITIVEQTIGTRLRKHQGAVSGIGFIQGNTGARGEIRAKGVLLASGGYGAVWGETTNPEGATGDGIVLAWEAGASVADLEFVQFHPTALQLPGRPRFLLTEALRGDGAILVDPSGRRFMPDHHPLAELAPRDVIARAIVREKHRQGISQVFLDARGIGEQALSERFPGVIAGLQKEGLDLTRQPIPVGPASHYSMGGVVTGVSGETSIPGLWAAGECASVGIHGANRLASNSLLECLVFGGRAAESMLGGSLPAVTRAGDALDDFGFPHPLPVERVRRLMDEHLGVERDGPGLDEMVDRFSDGLEALETGEFPLGDEPLRQRSLNIMAGLTAIFAQARLESRGAHFRRDAPEPVAAWNFRQVMTGLRLDRLLVGHCPSPV